MTETVWPQHSGWWPSYRDRLEETGIGRTSREVIEEDSRYIVDRCVFGAGAAGDPRWPGSRQRTGVVMGAVQSGKTASMMAVTAMALDAGVDCVVVLAGTRRSLWLQTLERFIAQVDSAPGKFSRRVLLPNPSALAVDATGTSPASLYSLSRPAVKAMLTASRPLIVVAMKNTAHLEHVGRLMREVIAPEVEIASRPFHMMVIDDEADDSSIDNMVEVPGAASDIIEFKQTPRRILDLWESRNTPGATFNQHFHATYMAYTATPQANFLQGVENPLAPRDFVVGLRAPGATGNPQVRTPSYRVPEGIGSWYTGGEIFYRAFANVPLCVPNDDSDESLVGGVRAYLVAAGIRHWRKPGKSSPVSAAAASYDTLQDALDSVPAVTSMLVNPSGVMGDHFDVAGRIHAWSAGRQAPLESQYFLSLADRAIGRDGIARDMQSSPELWIRWLESYTRSAAEVSAVAGVAAPPVPAVEDWDDLAKIILEEIVPATTIAVINSDEHADDRPQFEPRREGTHWRAPANLSTIFVSGNVMSRGLTLEGLLTTVFTRSASNPLADTQMQMQRWFGYRGSYVDLCRVFMRAEQIDLFTRYHDNDELLRSDILMGMGEEGTPDPTILQGRDFVATGKIANVRGVSLSPQHRAFFGLMNSPGGDESNRELVARLFDAPHLLRGDPESPQGILLRAKFDLDDTAGLLDKFVYVRHGADPEGHAGSRWESASRIIGLEPTDSRSPLYRAPVVNDPFADVQASPYTIAAYLRFWSACLNRRVPGLYTTDTRPRRWSTLDASERAFRDPSFSVGVRFGSGRLVAEGALAHSPVRVRTMNRTVRPGNRIDPAWGSQNAPQGGDDFFDYAARNEVPNSLEDRTRPPGADGLVLFHVIDRGDDSPTIAVGCVIPRGGPDWVQATRGTQPHEL